ncbi:hypothetical protein [Caballeronia sp. GAFFF1]|uniref:hypothetical protein n=1 Tax=Caballeronia sp. GAFFF1 TaxID=2921779 RepID=UPI002028CA93|nr:hypothetical protein [Caballeronia sp. GAFFF1]
MITFTLDTNCLLAVDEGRPEAGAVMALSAAHAEGKASVALVAISASERQRAGAHLESFTDFQKRVESLGLGHLDLLPPMLIFDVTFWDFSVWSDDGMMEKDKQIHEVLFPGIPYEWEDFCKLSGLDPTKLVEQSKKWRNARCDVQALWSHVHAARDVFVTSDRNFHAPSRAERLSSLFGVRVASPDSAATLLTN